MILATNNKNKIKEIKNILSNYELKSLAEVNVNIDVEENILSARYLAAVDLKVKMDNKLRKDEE